MVMAHIDTSQINAETRSQSSLGHSSQRLMETTVPLNDNDHSKKSNLRSPTVPLPLLSSGDPAMAESKLHPQAENNDADRLNIDDIFQSIPKNLSLHSYLTKLEEYEARRASEEQQKTPQHRYGEEGCDWMESKNRWMRDSPSVSDDIKDTPGFICVELTTENLKLHERELELRAVRVPEEWANISDFLPVYGNKFKSSRKMKKWSPFCSSSNSCEILYGVLFAGCWCALLSLSLSATAISNSTYILWLAIYIAGGLALLMSIFMVLLQICSDKHRNMQDGQRMNNAIAKANIYEKFDHQIFIMLEAFRCCTALFFLCIHGAALSICRRDFAIEHIINESDRNTMCSQSSNAMYASVIVISCFLLLASMIRICSLASAMHSGDR